ncbi:unnamed protein product [Rotaria socialis]|uniref:Peptidase M1 leukotriene A4 hydrolase/aminopeptidase C-terminal domain-containing protein n=1 Tax=Rotaria socialis TaxID=392032 RepID=A0A818AEN6_9BILA|nr:unnamed protein product [Rotaria socialis]
MSTDHSINESQRIRLFYDPNSLSNFNKYRIIHTYFDLTVDFDSSILDGYVQLYIKQLDNKLCDYSSSITTENKEIPNDHGNKLILDSHHLNIEKVLLKINNSEKELRYEIDKERELLTIEMNEISNDSIISVFIYYSTSNTKCIALKWLKKEQTTDKQYPYMFSQCQAIHARSLYPCQDTPGVKSTFTAKIACPKPLTVLMSGLQRKHDENTNTFYFEQNQAIPSYLVAIAVGHLVSYDLSPRIRLWTEPSMIKQCQYEFKDAEQFLTTAEQLLGEYKWKRYDFLVLPLSVPYIRMENPCMNFLSPTLLADHHSLRSTIVHEMTHSWTGNLVTHENWEHFWLNEGFTSFIEAKILGNLAKRNGNEVRRLHAAQQWQDFKNAIDTLGSTQPYTCLVYRLNNIDPDVVYACGSVQCYKGVALWHLEQNIIGSESKFEEFIRSYSIKFGGKNLNTDDFIQYFKSYFPQASSVDWQSWIYTLGMPPITHDYSTQLEQQCHKLANQQTSITQQQIESFNVEQIAYILNLLLNQKSSIIYDKIKQLDVDCNISKYSNWNIRILWYQLCIRVKYYDVLDDLFKFLEINGCTKFVKLLYAEFKSSWPNMMLKAEKFFQEHERIESSMQMKILIDLLDSIREISQSFNIRKKRSKYAQVVESLKESITHLIKQIKNSEITMVEIRKQYISIIENMNIEIDRLGQVVEGQQNPQMKRDFESIKLNFQVEKDKQSTLKTSKPHVGEIYKIRVGLESRLEEFLSTMSETNSSSSSSTSASTSLSSRKQKGQSQGRRRPCLIWNTENEGIEVLPIASFGGKDLAKIKTDIQCTISSKDFFNYVLSIHPIASPPNKRSLRPKIIKSMSKPLTGYLILMPIVISDSTPLHGPMPVVFEKNDMLYINNKLDALIKEKQDKIIENIDYSKIIANTQYDDDDSSSQETAHSIPNARSCLFEINHFDKNNLIENWLSKYDDDIKMHNEWQYIDDLAYKDSIEWNPENDDQLNEASVDLYLYPVLHITNLLPIDIQCLFDVELEVVETISDKEQDKWKSVNPKEIIPFWSHNIKDGIMCDHYKHSRAASSSFMMNEKYRTLLRMNDKERPVIYVRVSAANFDGLRVIFGDYKIDDAPLLVNNCLKNDSVSFSPINNVRTKILPPQNYVYHAWLDSSKSKELVISCGLKKTKLELTSQCGFLGKNDDCNLSYTICVVGTQTILLVTDDPEIIEAASAMSSLAQSGQPAQIVFHDNGLSLVNSITEEEMLYISLNKSKVIRTKTRTCFLRPYIAHEVMGFCILNVKFVFLLKIINFFFFFATS